ncbi:MAG: ATP-binding protein, partial [Caldivirga sp.]
MFWGRNAVCERPKARREDLFDRVKEVSEVINAIDKGRPIIVLSGIRRIGKTSVLLVALNEVNVDSVLIDCRALKENYGRRELYALFSTAFSSKLDKLRDVLKGIRGVSIMGNYVELKWSGRDYLSLTELFDKLNRRRLVIVLDEAQRLRGPLANEVKDAIAHAYDYDRNLTFILTGSEVGLLHEL